MKVNKPYTLKQTSSSSTKPTKIDEGGDQEVSTEVPPAPTDPVGPSTVALPSPPPHNLYLYRIVPASQDSTAVKQAQGPNASPSVEAIKQLNAAMAATALSSSQPGGSVNPPNSPSTSTATTQKTKPRVIHEYYDQNAFQWREFNPEDTVVGDITDPFIVYFRYVNKSIGARRTPWILPKHPKLIKIMQDCFPEFDWRTGEDLLVVICMKRLIIVESKSVISKTENFGGGGGEIEEG